MPELTYTRTTTIDGIPYSSTEKFDRNGGTIFGPVHVPKGKAGTLSTRTNTTSGVLTVAAGHGFYNGEYFDLYWDGGQRRHQSVLSHTDTTITFDSSTGGAGDNLPVVTTPIVASHLVNLGTNSGNGDFVAFQFTGTTAKCTIQEATQPEGANGCAVVDGGYVAIYEDDDYPIANIGSGDTGDENNVYLSNGSSVADAFFTLRVLFDITPGSSS